MDVYNPRFYSTPLSLYFDSFSPRLSVNNNRVNLAARLPNLTAQGANLLDQMLQFDPRKRISVQAALEHPYLATYHDPTNEPVASGVFKADFENIDMDKTKLRQLVYAEIESFHPELRGGAPDQAGSPAPMHPSKRMRASDGGM